MSLIKLLSQVEYLVDSNGNKKAVQIDLGTWREILELIKDLADDEGWDEAFANSQDALAELADEERQAYETTEAQDEHHRKGPKPLDMG